MYLCIYVYTYTCIYVYTYICIHQTYDVLYQEGQLIAYGKSINGRKQSTSILVDTQGPYTYIRIYVYTYIRIYIYMYIHIYVYTASSSTLKVQPKPSDLNHRPKPTGLNPTP